MGFKVKKKKTENICFKNTRVGVDVAPEEQWGQYILVFSIELNFNHTVLNHNNRYFKILCIIVVFTLQCRVKQRKPKQSEAHDEQALGNSGKEKLPSTGRNL